MKQNIIIIGLLLSVLVLSGCTSNEEPETIYVEKKEISGVIYDVQITDTFTVVVFERNFCLTFYEPSAELINIYPYLDSFKNAYTSMILLKGLDVTVHYVHYGDSDDINYFEYCTVNV